jgi:hypothetical protein
MINVALGGGAWLVADWQSGLYMIFHSNMI